MRPTVPFFKFEGWPQKKESKVDDPDGSTERLVIRETLGKEGLYGAYLNHEVTDTQTGDFLGRNSLVMIGTKEGDAFVPCQLFLGGSCIGRHDTSYGKSNDPFPTDQAWDIITNFHNNIANTRADLARRPDMPRADSR